MLPTHNTNAIDRVALGHSEPFKGLRVPLAHPDEAVDEVVKRDFFDRQSLDRFTFKQRLVIRAADCLFFSLIAAIGPTMRWEFEGREHLERICQNGHRAIICFWHNRIFDATWFWRRRRIVVMTSQSLDGEYIARFIQRFGYGAARGSSTRGGVRALLGLDRALKAGFEVAFTVDGPKGPVYEAKPGPVMLARKSGHPILPMHISSSSFWQIASWDRLRIPKPFARARAVVGEPIYVPRTANEAEQNRALAALQSALDDLRERFG